MLKKQERIGQSSGSIEIIENLPGNYHEIVRQGIADFRTNHGCKLNSIVGQRRHGTWLGDVQGQWDAGTVTRKSWSTDGASEQQSLAYGVKMENLAAEEVGGSKMGAEYLPNPTGATCGNGIKPPKRTTLLWLFSWVT